MTPQLRLGWTGSIIFHLLLLLLAIVLRLPQAVKTPEFIDVSWMTMSTSSGSSAPAVPAVRPRSTPSTTTPAPVLRKRSTTTTAPPRRTIPLPQRRAAGLEDDALNVSRRSEKVDRDIAEDPSAPDVARPAQRGEPSGVPGGTVSGRGTDRVATGVPGSAAGTGIGGPGVSGSGLGVGFDVQWTGDGGTRKKISGDLPKYPEGTNVAAQVRIEATVLPDGSVRMVQPVQKANTSLEDAAMKALKLWRFEPLRANSPQVEQSCVVTFLFRLR